MAICAAEATRRMSRRNGHIRIERGGTTAVPMNVRYRVGKLDELGLGRGRWLDCGCGWGEYTLGLRQRSSALTVGVDVEFDRVVDAQRRAHGTSRIQFGCASADALPFRDASFDGVFLNEVLEHAESEERSLREIYRVLRPGGVLALMSPNRLFPFEGHGLLLGQRRIDIPVPLLPWLPEGVAGRFMRARNYWPGELRDLVQAAGLAVVRTGSVFPMFEQFPVLPGWMVPRYRRLVPHLERLPLVRRCGLSTFVVARRPGEST
jgi:SAM-dependent methyltransferase